MPVERSWIEGRRKILEDPTNIKILLESLKFMGYALTINEPIMECWIKDSRDFIR
jgi:hypothetical protein